MRDLFAPIVAERDGARVAVLPYGAHVTSWTTPDERERLFVSARSAYRVGAAVRGGVPIIFPQFSTEGPLPRHGFARTRAWSATAHDASGVSLGLADDAETRAIWPHGFLATYRVEIVAPDALRLSLTVENTGGDALAFTAALHTYLRVDDAAAVSIDGLAGVRFRDQTAGGAERAEHGALRVTGEVDRVYLDVPGPVTLREPGRAVAVDAAGFADVVVWNPGVERARELVDLEPDGWRRFVCVEAAAVARPVRLVPNEAWTGTQTLRALDAAAPVSA